MRQNGSDRQQHAIIILEMRVFIFVILVITSIVSSDWMILKPCNAPNPLNTAWLMNGDCVLEQNGYYRQYSCSQTEAIYSRCVDPFCLKCQVVDRTPLSSCVQGTQAQCSAHRPDLTKLFGKNYLLNAQFADLNCTSPGNKFQVTALNECTPAWHEGFSQSQRAVCDQGAVVVQTFTSNNCSGDSQRLYKYRADACDENVYRECVKSNSTVFYKF